MTFFLTTAGDVQEFAQKDLKPEVLHLCIHNATRYVFDTIFHDNLKGLTLSGRGVRQLNNKMFLTYLFDSGSIEEFKVLKAGNINRLHQLFWKGRLAATLTKLALINLDVRAISRMRFYRSFRFSFQLRNLEVSLAKRPSQDKNLAMLFNEILLKSNVQRISLVSRALENNVEYVAELLRRCAREGRKISRLYLDYVHDSKQIALVTALHRISKIKSLWFENVPSQGDTWPEDECLRFLESAKVIAFHFVYSYQF